MLTGLTVLGIRVVGTGPLLMDIMHCAIPDFLLNILVGNARPNIELFVLGYVRFPNTGHCSHYTVTYYLKMCCSMYMYIYCMNALFHCSAF